MSSRSEQENQPARLAIVGTDLKFISPLVERFEQTNLFEVRVDEWPKFRSYDPEVTSEILDWAEIVVCEWAGPNAVLASRLKRPDQRLVIRLHRMELSHPEWRDIDIDAVDVVVTVGPYYRRRVLETTGWPEAKMVVVPNFVDEAQLALPKTDGARFNLGMIGIASSRKRLDLGLEVLREVRRRDVRYQLFLKGSYPWGLKWVEDRSEETAYFEHIRRQLEDDPLLAGAVHFDPPGPDVGDWLRKIGFLLSMSDDESFHLSPAEGMASGAVPMIRPWPGADEIYDPHWVVDGVERMADRVLSLERDEQLWRSEGERAQREILSKYDLDIVSEMWIRQVLAPDVGEVVGRARDGSRICIVSRSNATKDPGVRALAHSLDLVGHHVSLVCAGRPEPGLPKGVEVVSTRTARARSRWRSIARRLGSGGRGDRDRLESTLRQALAKASPDIVYPHRPEDMQLADRVDAPVLRRPEWPFPPRDLISLAPHSHELSRSAADSTVQPHQPTDWPASIPKPGRFEGEHVVIAYRVTPTSPGRYLESALRRSGASVTVLDGGLDWDQVKPDTSFVVVVESPYPALEVRGAKPRVPVLFWIHHGEHHLSANLRLADRYQADAMLMAHSWHLAHRFPLPVHRFPFGVPIELIDEPRSWADRTYDVAMVGAGIGGSGGRYDRRRHLVDVLEADDRLETRFTYGLPPEEMMALYGDARVVLNDGGLRHFPITMRVFEALGAGAMLLTEDLPGLDVILESGQHYVVMEDDVATQLRSLLGRDSSREVAIDGHQFGLARHTYDHRVDRLFELAGDTRLIIGGRRSSYPGLTPLGSLIDEDVEVQHLAVFGEVEPLGLEDRAIRPGDTQKLREGSIDAVVIGRGPVVDLRRAALAARGYVYSEGEHSQEVEKILADAHPGATRTVENGMMRIDLGGTPYRMRSADHPLAS